MLKFSKIINFIASSRIFLSETSLFKKWSVCQRHKYCGATAWSMLAGSSFTHHSSVPTSTPLNVNTVEKACKVFVLSPPQF